MSSEKIVTPLDSIIIELSQYKSVPNSSIISLCVHQFSLLRVVYIYMIEDDFQEKFFSNRQGTRTLSDEEVYLYQPYFSYKVILNYNQFIFITNQFARALKKENAISDGSEFPNFFRNKFYRNIIAEHWEQYFRIQETSHGFSWRKNKAPIPSQESVSMYQERKELCSKLIDLFKQFGIDASELDKTAGQSILSVDSEYSNKIYSWLEQLDPKLETKKNMKIDKKLILNLLAYGFPVPINDIEVYLDNLINFIQKLVNLGGYYLLRK